MFSVIIFFIPPFYLHLYIISISKNIIIVEAFLVSAMTSFYSSVPLSVLIDLILNGVISIILFKNLIAQSLPIPSYISRCLHLEAQSIAVN